MQNFLNQGSNLSPLQWKCRVSRSLDHQQSHKVCFGKDTMGLQMWTSREESGAWWVLESILEPELPKGDRRGGERGRLDLKAQTEVLPTLHPMMSSSLGTTRHWIQSYNFGSLVMTPWSNLTPKEFCPSSRITDLVPDLVQIHCFLFVGPIPA